MYETTRFNNLESISEQNFKRLESEKFMAKRMKLHHSDVWF
jgi:hypothetical protein